MKDQIFWDKLTYALKTYRETAELTQKELAKKLGISESAYRSYELGDRHIPVDLLAKLALFYNESLDVLVGNISTCTDPIIVSGNFTHKQIAKIKRYAEFVQNDLL